LPLLIALDVILVLSSDKREEISAEDCWNNWLVGCLGGGFRNAFFLLLLGIFESSSSEKYQKLKQTILKDILFRGSINQPFGLVI
jgi:hypothetical protein